MEDSLDGALPGSYELNDSRYLRDEPPKEIWRHLVRDARARGFVGKSWCDVGCASGALLRFIDSEFTIQELVGVDPADSLLALAVDLGPTHARWILDELPPLSLLEGRTFDAVSCVGVLCLMDDIEANLTRLCRLLSATGMLFIVDLVNARPVDMIMRWRDREQREWRPAFNTFSKATYQAVAQSLNMHVSFRDADMPFAIPESENPMRAWTTQVGVKPHQVVSGTNQILGFTLATFWR